MPQGEKNKKQKQKESKERVSKVRINGLEHHIFQSIKNSSKDFYPLSKQDAPKTTAVCAEFTGGK